MAILNWLSDNYIEIAGAIAGIVYVFLEIRQHIWLWPVGIITSAIYVWVFFTGKLYADMSLQVYYLVISFLGWFWWVRGTGHMAHGAEEGMVNKGTGESTPAKASVDEEEMLMMEEGWRRTLQVTRLKPGTGIVLAIVFIFLYAVMWYILSHFTDSPVPEWDSFLTSLSVVATWMLARKIYEHWFLWIIVNAGSIVLFIIKGLYPTIILYIVYLVMSFIGLKEWGKTIIRK